MKDALWCCGCLCVYTQSCIYERRAGIWNMETNRLEAEREDAGRENLNL